VRNTGAGGAGASASAGVAPGLSSAGAGGSAGAGAGSGFKALPANRIKVKKLVSMKDLDEIYPFDATIVGREGKNQLKVQACLECGKNREIAGFSSCTRVCYPCAMEVSSISVSPPAADPPSDVDQTTM